MKTYRLEVTVTRTEYHHIEVDAGTDDEAKEKAIDYVCDEGPEPVDDVVANMSAWVIDKEEVAATAV